LMRAFGHTNAEEICRTILKSGELQVSDLERAAQIEGVLREVVQIVVERCVHPQTGRQLTAPMVEGALKSLGFSVNPAVAAKRQGLKAIQLLCTELPENICRAKMRLRFQCPKELTDEIQQYLREQGPDVTIEDSGGAAEATYHLITFVCEPSHYRNLDHYATVTKKDEKVSLMIITATVLQEGSSNLGDVDVSTFLSEVAPSLPRSSDHKDSATTQQKSGPKCSTCNVFFEDTAEYRTHCRTEWHNHNLRRKLKGLAPESEEDFKDDFVLPLGT